MTEESMKENSGEGDGKVEDDLERNGEGLRSSGVARYCQQPVFLEEFKANSACNE